jgi:hypothetical protein
MPIIEGPLSEHGAVVRVLVGVSVNRKERLKALGLPIPNEIPVPMQIDTGSSLTGLMPEVFTALELTPVERLGVRTPSTTKDAPFLCDVFDVSVIMPTPGRRSIFTGVRAIAGDFRPEDIARGIIGRDVLDRCNFEYFGMEQRFKLSWPD